MERASSMCDKSDMRLHIRELRQRLLPGETIERFAERVGMSREHLNQLELGKVTCSSRHVAMFATLFGVPEHDVLGYSHPPDADLSEPARELIHTVIDLNESAVEMLLGLAREMQRKGMGRTPDTAT